MHLCYHIRNLQSDQELHQGRIIFVLKITHQLIQSGCSLDHSRNCRGRMCGNALVKRDYPVTFGHCHVWSIEIG